MKKHDDLYMDMARLVSQQSRCLRGKVGAVIVKGNNIISFGWNGTPTGFNNDCECDGETKPEVVHAEANAIAKCAKSSESCEGATMYLTHSPCWDCSKLIIQSGITRVVYDKEYRIAGSLSLLDGIVERYEG